MDNNSQDTQETKTKTTQTTVEVNPPQPQPTVTTTTNSVTTGPKKSKTPMVVGILIAVLVLLGLAAWAVYAYVTNTPDYLLRSAAGKLAQQQTIASKYKIEAGEGSSKFAMNGDVAVKTDPNNSQNADIVIGIGENDKRVAANVKIVDGEVFMQPSDIKTNLPKLLSGISADAQGFVVSQEFKAIVDAIDGKWYQVDPKAAQEFFGSQGEVGDKVAADEAHRVLDIYNKNNFLSPDQTFADEDVEGVKTAHFSLKFDKDRYVKFLEEVKAANLQSFKVSDKDIEDAKKSKGMENQTAEVWIARTTQSLKKVKLASTKKGEESITEFTLQAEPQQQVVTKPTDARPFTELSEAVFSLYFLYAFQSVNAQLEGAGSTAP